MIEQFPQSVKSFGDFPDILAADNPDVWESHRPAKGGEAGAMLGKVIEEAAKLKAKREQKPARAKKSGVLAENVSQAKQVKNRFRTR